MAGNAQQRLPVMRDGEVVMAALALEVAQMEQGLGIARIGGERFSPGGFGGGVVAQGQRAAGAREQCRDRVVDGW